MAMPPRSEVKYGDAAMPEPYPLTLAQRSLCAATPDLPLLDRVLTLENRLQAAEGALDQALGAIQAIKNVVGMP